MHPRTEKSAKFAVALGLGFALFDFITLGTVDVVRVIGTAIIAGALYSLMLKIQGR